MKSTRKNRHPNVVPFRPRAGSPYPNAAGSSYFLQKALDFLLTAVTGLGAVSILICMLLLS